MNLNDWNKKLYRDDEGNFLDKEFSAEDFWNEFGIKSSPKFPNACWSHIPIKWAEDVRLFIKQVQFEFGNKVDFVQIKEKFCHFIVYFDYGDDEEIYKRVKQLERECVDRLINKNLHPKQGE